MPTDHDTPYNHPARRRWDRWDKVTQAVVAAVAGVGIGLPVGMQSVVVRQGEKIGELNARLARMEESALYFRREIVRIRHAEERCADELTKIKEQINRH